MTTITLDQGEWWQQQDGVALRISEMTPGHAHNAAEMLLRIAHRLAFNAALTMPPPNFNGEMAQYYAEREWSDRADWMIEHPEEWLESQPLMIALRARAVMTS